MKAAAENLDYWLFVHQIFVHKYSRKKNLKVDSFNDFKFWELGMIRYNNTLYYMFIIIIIKDNTSISSETEITAVLKYIMLYDYINVIKCNIFLKD